MYDSNNCNCNCNFYNKRARKMFAIKEGHIKKKCKVNTTCNENIKLEKLHADINVSLKLWSVKLVPGKKILRFGPARLKSAPGTITKIYNSICQSQQ